MKFVLTGSTVPKILFMHLLHFFFQAALSLPSRPPFHATTIILLVDAVLLLLSAITKSKTPVLYCLIFSVAWLSHHVRDAVRRGIWFYPFGSTPPLPKIVYLGIILTLPLMFGVVYRKLNMKDLHEKVIFGHAELVWVNDIFLFHRFINYERYIGWPETGFGHSWDRRYCRSHCPLT